MLFTILLLILFFVLFVPTFVMSLITRILSIFKFRDKGNSMHHSRGGERDSHTYDTYDSGNRKKSKKIFDKNEGEYVDFEEIK